MVYIDSQTEIVVRISTSILTGNCLQEMVNMFLFFSFSSLPSDHSLTVHNVQRVMEGVVGIQLSLVELYLTVPESILDKIDECSSDEEKASALAKYVVTILPNVTWEEIAAALYRDNEERAVERAKSYLHTVDIPGESCTLWDRKKSHAPADVAFRGTLHSFQSHLTMVYQLYLHTSLCLALHNSRVLLLCRKLWLSDQSHKISVPWVPVKTKFHIKQGSPQDCVKAVEHFLTQFPGSSSGCFLRKKNTFQ